MKATTRITTALILVAGATSANAQPIGGTSREFQIPIPELGQEFFFGNGIIPGSNDFNGGTIVDARLDLVLDVVDAPDGDMRTSSAEFFSSFIVVPVDIEPQEGPQLGIVSVSGQDEGWSGTGRFEIHRTLDFLIGGTYVSPVFYTAETIDVAGPNSIVAGTTNPFVLSFITLTVEAVPAPGSLAMLGLGVLTVSRRRR